MYSGRICAFFDTHFGRLQFETLFHCPHYVRGQQQDNIQSITPTPSTTTRIARESPLGRRENLGCWATEKGIPVRHTASTNHTTGQRCMRLNAVLDLGPPHKCISNLNFASIIWLCSSTQSIQNKQGYCRIVCRNHKTSRTLLVQHLILYALFW